MVNVAEITLECNVYGSIYDFKNEYPRFHRMVTKAFNLTPEKLQDNKRFFVKVYDSLLNNQRRSTFIVKYPNVYSAIGLACAKASSNSPAEGLGFHHNLAKTKHQHNQSQIVTDSLFCMQVNCFALQHSLPFLKYLMQLMYKLGFYSAEGLRSKHHLPGAVRQIEKGEFVQDGDDEPLSEYKKKHNRRLAKEKALKEFLCEGDAKLCELMKAHELQQKQQWMQEYKQVPLVLPGAGGARIRTSARPSRARKSKSKTSQGAGAGGRGRRRGRGRQAVQRGRQAVQQGRERGRQLLRAIANSKKRRKSLAPGALAAGDIDDDSDSESSHGKLEIED